MQHPSECGKSHVTVAVRPVNCTTVVLRCVFCHKDISRDIAQLSSLLSSPPKRPLLWESTKSIVMPCLYTFPKGVAKVIFPEKKAIAIKA